jgi:TrmH family RNA methyltransferase
LEDRATRKSAVHAESVLERAMQVESVGEALADCTFVLGTTAVGDRVLEHPLYTVNDAAPVIARHLAASTEAKVALLFGSEKTGLSNEELSHCHALLTIPMNKLTSDRHLSMNLGQAAAVCLYTLAQGSPVALEAAAEVSASAGEQERLTALLLQVLERSGYVRRHPANAREATIRRLVRRMGNSGADATVWSGILRQVLYALESRTGKPQDEFF